MDKRVKLYVLGNQVSEKTAIIQSLLGNQDSVNLLASPTSFSVSSATNTSAGNVSVAQWVTQFAGLHIEVWDLPDGEIQREVLFSTLTPGLFLLLHPVDKHDSIEMATQWSQINNWFPGSFVIITLYQTCPVDNKELTKVLEATNNSIHDWSLQRKVSFKKNLAEVKGIIKEAKIKCRNQNRKFEGRASLSSYVSTLRQAMKRTIVMNKPPIVVNLLNGLGISTLREKVISLASSVDFSSCTFGNISKESGLDDINKALLELLESGDIFIPWHLFDQMLNADLLLDVNARNQQVNKAIKQLEDAGKVKVFNLSSFKNSENSSFTQPNQCPQCGRSNNHLSLFSEKPITDLISFHKYICINPQVLASMLCDCFVSRDRKTFSLEASKFWPKDSGFKSPDPKTLANNLNLIPTKGVIREALFPILWQEHELCQTQIQYSLDVLEGLGILTSTKPEPTECSGLAMPEFPQLSPVECHALIFADQLPDTKPKLSWSPKPFSGDVQVTWQMVGITDISTTNIKRIFGVIQREFKHICLFSHLWNQGVLLKFKNNSATVCMEQSSNGLEVSCRVSGDDPGQESMVVMSLWAHLVPVIRAVEHFCNHFLPGFLYKVNLILFGDVFYNVSEPMPAEPVISYFKLLVAKRTGNHFIITEGGTGTINLDLLFPFSCEESRKVWTPQEWNQFVMNKYDEILNTVSPQLPATSHRQSFKVSCRKYKGRRKIAEVKWSQNLAEVKFDSFSDLTLAEYMDSEVVKESEHKVESYNPENNPGNTARETITQTSVKMTKSECTQTDGCLELSVSASDDWLKEATNVASKFVSAAMASGVAKYITTYGLCSGGIQRATSAEIAVAQITAEAASAVYNNDMYAAARAIIKAVQTVHETETSSNRNVASTSRLCTLL